MHTGARVRKERYISIYISLYMKTFLHGLSSQEKVSRFSMPLIPRYGTSLAVSHWALEIKDGTYG